MDELQDHRDDDMLESHQVWGFLILGCLCGPIATFSRLSLLETVTACRRTQRVQLPSSLRTDREQCKPYPRELQQGDEAEQVPLLLQTSASSFAVFTSVALSGFRVSSNLGFILFAHLPD